MDEQQRPVLLHRADGVAEIVLNRPRALNAINVEMAEGILSACREIAADSGVRVVVIRGEGKSFMAGGDLLSFHSDMKHAERTASRLIEPMNAVVTLLHRMNPPVIACVHGPVAGAGVSLAVACDLTIAADDASFNLAYGRVGASLDVGSSWTLPRIVGMRKALELALLSENVNAEEALRMHLISRVVPANELFTHAAALARQIADGPTRAFSAIKRLLRESLESELEPQIEKERVAFCQATRTADFAEGVDAFVTRRRPRFVGG
jgi:2-(1,2-epoxy-1,2-dihydrophenyl)acetyl-CoA isomerase